MSIFCSPFWEDAAFSDTDLMLVHVDCEECGANAAIMPVETLFLYNPLICPMCLRATDAYPVTAEQFLKILPS